MCDQCPSIDYEDDDDRVIHTSVRSLSVDLDELDGLTENGVNPVRYNRGGCRIENCIQCEAMCRGMTSMEVRRERGQRAGNPPPEDLF